MDPVTLSAMGKEIQKWAPYVPAAAATAASKAHLALPLAWPWLASGFIACFAITFVFGYKRQPHIIYDGYRIEDYDAPVPWARIFAPLTPLLTYDIGSAIGWAPPLWILSTLAFVLATIGCTVSMRHTFTLNQTVGPRRARKFTSLDGVTTERIDTLIAHRQLTRDLIQLNCFAGMRARVDSFAKATNRDPEELLAEVRELQQQGLASISTMLHPKDPTKWYVELSEIGVRNYEKARHG